MFTPSVKRFFLLLGVIYISLFFIFRWGNDPAYGWRGIIESDGKGYYSYLVHAFIDNDMQYRADEHLYATRTESGQYVNKFYCGTSLLQLPFYLVGHVSAYAFGYPVNGFSQPFALAIGFSSLFYSWLGMFFLFSFLRRYVGSSEKTALLVTALAALGSNLLFYSVIYGSFSHSYSFFAITCLLYQFGRLSEGVKTKKLLWAGLLLGVVIIIRPVNIIALLMLPAAFKNKTEFLSFLKAIFRLKPLFILVLTSVFPVFIQCLLWYLQTGNWIHWSYQQEGFYFENPQILEVLFGFRRGLFIYCPLLFLCMIGFVYGFKHKLWQTTWLLLSFILFTYVTASWWHWTYGDTFGIRPFNDVLILFMILLAKALTYSGRLKRLLVFSCALATLLNLVFAYQFARGITNISTMDREKFFSLFLHVGKKYEHLYAGENDIPPYAPNGFETIHQFSQAFDNMPDGKLFIAGNEWPGGTEFVYPAGKNHVRHFWLEISYKRRLETDSAMKNTLFVIHAINPSSDSTMVYSAFRVKEFPIEKTNEWKKVVHRLWIPHTFGGHQLIKLYLWNRGKENFELDDYTITARLPKW